MKIHSYTNKQHLLLLVPALVLLAVVAWIESAIIGQTGRVCYVIDDPYIHMAMARHFAEHGVFGVSLAGFSATSSSPLWTLLVGVLFRIVGNYEWIPLALNLLFGLILAVYLTRMLADRLGSAWGGMIGGLVLLFGLPLPTLIALGMEHTLHILLMLMLMERVCGIIGQEDPHLPLGGILLIAFLAMLVRFETAFVVAPLILFGLLDNRWKVALALAGACALPLLVLGWINLQNGWFFFPTSVKLKSALSLEGWERVETIGKRLYGQLFGAPHMVIPFVLGLGALYSTWRREALTHRDSLWTGALVVGMVFHCGLASIGWFYRYEGYLLAMAAVALAPFVREGWAALGVRLRSASSRRERGMIAASLVGLILLFPFPFYKHFRSIQDLVPAARNIYSQQYQMGLFLKQFYEGEAVLANDIGAINYVADIDCLDVMGLGSVVPIRAKQRDQWNARFLHSWCVQHRVSVIVVYESWVKSLIPPNWIKVGEWTVDEKVSVADSTVAFFAMIPPDAQRLRQNLKTFESELPAGVTWILMDE